MDSINRRTFVRDAGCLVALGLMGAVPSTGFSTSPPPKPVGRIKIKNVDSNFEREPLYPYRFKGSAITEAWQVASLLESESGIRKVGIGCQGVL
jgi:hypothetical protein